MNARTLHESEEGITLDPQISLLGEHIQAPVKKIFFPNSQNDFRFRYLYPRAKIINAKHAEDPSEEYDLVILSRERAGKIWGVIFPNLKEGGFVVTDNYYDMARALYSSNELKLVGCSHESQGWLDTKQCRTFLQEVDRDWDWNKTSDYATAERIRWVAHRKYSESFWVDNPEESMTDWHRRIRWKVLNALARWYVPGEPIAKIEEMVAVQTFRDFPPRLPLKKESLHDLFLFQKTR